MNDPEQAKQTSIYRIQVKDHLDPGWEHRFEGFSIHHLGGGVTVLTGEVADQSALHGLLQRLQSLNLTLLSVQILDKDIQER